MKNSFDDRGIPQPGFHGKPPSRLGAMHQFSIEQVKMIRLLKYLFLLHFFVLRLLF